LPGASRAHGERFAVATEVDASLDGQAIAGTTVGQEVRRWPARAGLLARASDEMLAREVRLGNNAAFQVIYERYGGGVRSMCRHLLRSPEDAEDAVQQSMASAWSYLRAANHDLPQRLRPWLYAIAQNRCLAMLRDRVPDRLVVEDQRDELGYVDQVECRLELRMMLADLRDLPIAQRQALVLSELGGLSHADVADRLGRTQPRVKSLVFEARATLHAWREARDTPCDEIRRQLSTLHGGSLRRRTLRRHLELCDACRLYRAHSCR
jgi:RNA polymerase sigma factor (sigma-70 family)